MAKRRCWLVIWEKALFMCWQVRRLKLSEAVPGMLRQLSVTGSMATSLIPEKHVMPTSTVVIPTNLETALVHEFCPK